MKNILLSTVAMATMFTAANAGTIDLTDRTGTTAGDAFQLSSELHTANAGAGTTAAMATVISSYTPTAIPLGTLTDPAFNITMTNGVLNVPANTVLCSVTNAGTVVGEYATGTGTAQVVFQAPGGGSTISNNVAYVFGIDAAADGTCDGAAHAMTVDLPQGELSESMTMSAGTAATQVIHDTATAGILSTVTEYSASNTGLLDGQIDAADDFLTFTGAVAADVLTTTISRAYTDASVAEADDFLTVTLNSTVALPTVTVTAVDNAVAAAAVTAATGDMSWSIVGTGTQVVANADTFVTTLTTDGTTVIPETTFTTDVEIDFSGTTVQGTSALLTSAAAGNWSIFGYNGTVPYVSTGGTTTTVFKVNNSSTTPAEVFWTVTDDAGITVSNLSVNAVLGDANSELGAGEGNAWLASSIQAAAAAVNPAFGTSFRATVIVPTTPTDVSAVAVMQIDGGRDRIIPVLHANDVNYLAE